MRKKILFPIVLLMALLTVQGISIVASQMAIPNYFYYTKHETAFYPSGADPIQVRFKNGIDINKKTAGAETWTSSPTPWVSVTATFYWVDFSTETFGSNYQYASGNGAREVYGDTLTGARQFYYKVVSSHVATYGGAPIPDPDLTTDISPYLP